MTKFEAIVSKAQYAVCIVSNSATSDYELLEFPVPDKQQFIERGMSFVGVLALVDWIPCSALAAPLDRDTVEDLSGRFTRLVVDRMRQSEIESVRWLNRLHQLPDGRPN